MIFRDFYEHDDKSDDFRRINENDHRSIKTLNSQDVLKSINKVII